MNKKFTFINNNSIFKKIKIESVEKAYVEGVYSDSPANRKLGRVGMSYREYANLTDKEEVESKSKKINEIPENIQDLKFINKEGRKIASYKLDNNNVEIELVSNIKYQDNKYTMTIKNEEGNLVFKEENAAQIAKKMKALKNKQLYMSDRPLYKILPLTPEELDAKWGDTGFTYTYFKDDLDIKVWLRDDSDKKNPQFNIYVKDTKSKKQRNFTKLSLKETHDKLLDFDLNPDIDKPLSDSQMKEKNKILAEEGNTPIPLIKEDNKNKIIPSKNINIDFDEYGRANFKKGNYAIKIIVNPKNKSLLDIISYEVKRIENEGEKPYYKTKVLGVDSANVNNFDSKMKDLGLEEDIQKKNQIDYILGEKDNYDLSKPKDFIEDYSNGAALYNLPGVRFYKWDRESAKGNREVQAALNKKKFYSKYEKFNQDKISAIEFVKSGELSNWLNTMPVSKKFTKQQIISKINEKIDRLSPNSNNMGLDGDSGVRYTIVNDYF